jgi:hypothetical protein
MRIFDTIFCSVLKMKGCRNAPAGFAMSVCLVPVNVTTVECNCVCVTVCVCVCVCERERERERCLTMLSVAKVSNK